jgi:hypothetical protein
VLFENPEGAAFRLAFIIIEITLNQGGMRRLKFLYARTDEPKSFRKKVITFSEKGTLPAPPVASIYHEACFSTSYFIK